MIYSIKNPTRPLNLHLVNRNKYFYLTCQIEACVDAPDSVLLFLCIQKNWGCFCFFYNFVVVVVVFFCKCMDRIAALSNGTPSFVSHDCHSRLYSFTQRLKKIEIKKMKHSGFLVLLVGM